MSPNTQVQAKGVPKSVIIGVTSIVIILAGLIFGGAQLFEQGKSEKVAFVAERETDFVYGNKAVTIRFILYGDVSCQYCRVLYPQLKALVDTYPEKASLIYRSRPVYDKGYDAAAMIDMQVAQCVGEYAGSDAYYTYVDTLYQSVEGGVRLSSVPFSLIEAAVLAAGLSLEEIRNCTEDISRLDKILAERERLRIFGARVVPYTFIFVQDDMYEVSGNKPIDVYEEFITWTDRR